MKLLENWNKFWKILRAGCFAGKFGRLFAIRFSNSTLKTSFKKLIISDMTGMIREDGRNIGKPVQQERPPPDGTDAALSAEGKQKQDRGVPCPVVVIRVFYVCLP